PPRDKKRGERIAPPVGITEACWRLESGGADPAGLGDVDGHSIGSGVLDLDVTRAMAVLTDAERLVDVVARRGPGLLQPLRDLLEALDLEADVMDAAPAGAALDPRHLIVLEVQDREVELAVAQVVAA